MVSPLTLDSALATLYGEDPRDFVARRTELVATAKSGGDAELAATVKGLRKPTAAAAVVNRLPDADLAAVLDLGRSLRAAQTRLDAESMKALTRERQAVLARVVDGLEVSASVREEVRATLLAATADASAADAVSSRSLVRALSYSGWGDVDVADALAHQHAAERGRAALRLVAPARSGGKDAGGTDSGNTDSGNSGSAPSAGADTTAGDEADASADATAESSVEQQREREEKKRRSEQEAARASALRDVERAEARLRAAQAALDAASAARDAALTSLARAQARLEEVDAS